MNKPIIQCNQVTKIFRGYENRHILSDINFSVNEGEIIAIIGASGSGKTTLLHLLGGLDTPSQGDIKIMGKSWKNMSKANAAQSRNQYLGFVFQLHLLLSEFSSLENTAMPLLLRDMDRKLALNEAKILLETVGLSSHLYKTPEKLSGGERQRVAIARALIGKPRCILADEPTGNLDRKNADNIFHLLLSASHEQGNALVLVTHDERFISHADRIITLEDGKFK